jgi:hypothetical protein
LPVIGGPTIGGAADGDGKGKIVRSGGSWNLRGLFGHRGVDAGDGDFGSGFEPELGLVLIARGSAAARAIRCEALGDFAAPSDAGLGA